MLATATPDPGRLPAGPGWTYEVKWDGMRVLADVTHRPVSVDTGEASGRVRLRSRNDTDVTVTFPELEVLAGLPDVLLDGEVVAFDAAGLPSFPVLAERLHVRSALRAAGWARRVPVTYLVFDVLRLHGELLVARPLAERRALLERLDLPPQRVRLSPWYPDGDSLLSATASQGLEGVVAKRLDAPYEPGRRSPSWVKAAHRQERTVLVGGWRPQADTTATVGALLVGAPDAGGLRYLGRVGSGIGAQAQAELSRLLPALRQRRSPFADDVPAVDARGATWVEPLVTVSVHHLGWTTGGRLRQPSYRGVRRDVTADAWQPR